MLAIAKQTEALQTNQFWQAYLNMAQIVTATKAMLFAVAVKIRCSSTWSQFSAILLYVQVEERLLLCSAEAVA